MKFILIFLISYTLTGVKSFDDFEADFDQHSRFVRDGADYGKGLGGPIAAKSDTSDSKTNTSTLIDECENADSSSQKKQTSNQHLFMYRDDVSLPRKKPKGKTTGHPISRTIRTTTSRPKVKSREKPKDLSTNTTPRPKMKSVEKPKDPSPKAGGSDSNYNIFTQLFKKPAGNPDFLQRSNIFQNNLKRIDQLNSGILKTDQSAICGVTRFADLSHEEFVKVYTGTIADPPDILSKVEFAEKDLKNHPETFDWRKQSGVLGLIRSQGECGSCYAFASADVISAQNAIETNRKWKTLSTQYVIDCIGKSGCSGARIGQVMKNVVSEQNGVPLEQCNPYRSAPNSCNKNLECCIWQKIKWFQIFDASGAKEKDIIASVLQWGPVISVIDASEIWQFYNGTGIIKANQCTPDRQNHAISIVGYDYSGPIPYYVIRNSWGNDWGDGGYAKLEAGTNACSVAKTVTTVCTKDCDRVKNANSLISMSKAKRSKAS